MRVALEGVTKRFGDLTVVDDISQEIHDGEIFFLLGPSGCGKTTLLRSVAGFYIPEAGVIRIGDRDVTRVPAHQRDTGMVFQSYALWPHMTVRENVAFGLDLRKVTKDEIHRRVTDALAMVQMTPRADYRPSQLSGGQQQRVALARALVIRPQCLLLDEPLSNLDAKLRLEMRGEIRRICKDAGLTAIYVTHDQKEALSIADRLAIMQNGKLAQCGAPREVYERPTSRFVAHFIGETNFVDGRVRERTDHRLTIETNAGEVVSEGFAIAGVEVGHPVTLSIRPEVIHVGSPPDDTVNVFRGGLHNTVYLGEMAQHQVNIKDGERADLVFRVFDMHPKVLARDDCVQDVEVWFRPQNVVVLGR